MKIPAPALDLSPENYKKMVIDFFTAINNLTVSDNFAGQILSDVFLPSGVDVAVPHSLKVPPKYRIILRQTGTSVIVDGSTPWNDTQIFLQAPSADCVVTLLVLRG